MLDQLSWLAKKEELEYSRKKFKGKTTAVAWKYARQIDGLIRTRAIIFLMSLLVFYPVLTNALFHGVFYADLLIERIVFSMIFLAAGLGFHKYRVAAILLAVIPVIGILSTYLSTAGQFDIRIIAFMIAILLLILSGLYYHFQAQKLKKELDRHLLENHLIDQ